MHKLIRITTVPLSLEKLLEGQLNFMQDHYKVTAISSDEKKLKELGVSLGVETYPVEMTRQITPGKDIQSVVELYKYFKKERPLIVHTHTPKAGIAGMVAAKLAGVPIRLHTVAGLPLLEAKGMTRSILEVVEKITYSCATRVYPNSKMICEFLVNEKYAPRDKFKVIANGSSNGIDIHYFDPSQYSENDKLELRSSLEIPASDIVFVFVGRMVRDKGINELVEAFEKVNEVLPDTSLLLIGPFEQHLDPVDENTLDKIRRHRKIVEVGYQDDVRPYLACSDVLAFPSYREGFPNVVLQAGAMGLPSIVTDINGCNEIISDGMNGRIIPVRDTAALYRTMMEMGRNETEREKLAKRARASIVKKYDRQQVWKALLSEYMELEKNCDKKLIPDTA